MPWTAAHSPGGLGKTALARQYAHAYAEFYAAGGTWEIGCEGASTLGLALLKLADDPRLKTAGQGLIEPLVLSDAQRADPDLAAAAVLDYPDRLSHLIARHATQTLLQSAQVAADFEGEHNTLSRALDLTERILQAKEKLLAAAPDSEDLARDVSVSLNKLADFLASRGQAGDAEQALGHYQRSLEVRERLLVANPESAQAARDVMVSHFKFSHFHHACGDEGKAMQSLTACFTMLDSFARAGRPMDAPMRGVYEQLKPMFSTGHE